MSKRKILYILRHAKTETGAPTQDDHTRALTERGILAAESMGKTIAAQGIRPDYVICSTAERARKTWEKVCPAFGAELPMKYSDKAYLASENELLALITQVPETVGSLLLVGHNPGLHQLCLKLAKRGDDELLDALMMRFPTCTFVAIDLGETTWADVARAQGELAHLMMPKQLGIYNHST